MSTEFINRIRHRLKTFTEADARHVERLASRKGIPWMFVIGGLVALTVGAVASPFAMGKGILPLTVICAGFICYGYVYARRQIRAAMDAGNHFDVARFGFTMDMSPYIVVYAVLVPRFALYGAWRVLGVGTVLFAVFMVGAFLLGPWWKVTKLSPEALRRAMRDPSSTTVIDLRR